MKLLASALRRTLEDGVCYIGFSEGRADIRFGMVARDNRDVRAGHVFVVVHPQRWGLVEAIPRGVSETHLLKEYGGQWVSIWEPVNIPHYRMCEIRELALKQVGQRYGFGELPGYWLASRAQTLPLVPQSWRDGLAAWVLRRFDQDGRIVCHIVGERVLDPFRELGYDFGTRERRGPDYFYDWCCGHPKCWRCVGEGVLVVDVAA